jgi:hypothetical protein
MIPLAVFDLASSDIPNEFGELYRITWALLASFRHVTIIAQLERGRTAVSRPLDFKLTHYPFASCGRLIATSVVSPQLKSLTRCFGKRRCESVRGGIVGCDIVGGDGMAPRFHVISKCGRIQSQNP